MIDIETALERFEEIREHYKKEHDREEEHIMADRVLLDSVPEEIKQAYDKLRVEIGFWYA